MVTLERRRIAVFSQRIEGAASGTQSCPALRTMYALVKAAKSMVIEPMATQSPSFAASIRRASPPPLP